MAKKNLGMSTFLSGDLKTSNKRFKKFRHIDKV